MGVCGVTIEQIVQEREEVEFFILPCLECFLPLKIPDLKSFLAAIAGTRWILKEQLTGPFVKVLDEQFTKLRAGSIYIFNMHLKSGDDILTVVCNGQHKAYGNIVCGLVVLHVQRNS